jgi:putative FmdB family regulatory protein
MPWYDLRCPNCGHEFDDLVPSHDAVASLECERCGHRGMELKPSLFASRTSSGTGSYSYSGESCGNGGFT